MESLPKVVVWRRLSSRAIVLYALFSIAIIDKQAAIKGRTHFHKLNFVCDEVADSKMSKNCLFLVLAACSLSAFAIVEAKVASKKDLTTQKIVLELLWRVDQPELKTEHWNLGKDYDIKANLGSYTREDYVLEFLHLFKHGLLPRGEIFSVFYSEHLEQAIALFRVFYYSKDFDTLHKTAAWARIHLNEGIFVYAFSVAVLHSPHTKQIQLPALSEIFPQLYFDDFVIRKAFTAKTNPNVGTLLDDGTIIIPVNNSQMPLTGEQTLNYFTGDITLNNLPYYSHLAHPFWMSTEEYKLVSPIRGEIVLWAYKLQLARYKMERLSNGLGDVEDFDWNYPIPTGYFPSWSYPNGLSVRHREPYTHIPSHKFKFLRMLRDYELRISMAIDMGHTVLANGTLLPIRNPDGIQILGNLLEGNADSVNPDVYGSYDRLARNVLGFNPEPLNKHKVYPSALEHFGVDQKDPIYWSFVQKIVGFYEQFVEKLPKYTLQELSFPGVGIESVIVDKITTFFEPADHLISGAVPIQVGENNYTLIKARQYRLTHKPYTMQITVNSEKNGQGSVRVFFGPRRDVHHEEIPIYENWKNFIILDEFIVDLKAGKNVFERSSTQGLMGVPNEETGDLFYQRILKAIEGDEPYEIPIRPLGYPERMLIPKGTEDGTLYQFLVFISPYKGEELYHSKSPVFGTKDLLNKRMGWPLDRPAAWNMTHLSNMYLEPVNVHHVHSESEINATV